MKSRFCYLFFCFLLKSVAGFTQVLNDNIENRIELKIDAAPFKSETNSCTVQWTCVDEALTGKAIDYHNDQWFWFKPVSAATYYINISGQKCRDIKGVQLVVLDGQPCKPETYKILSFASLASQDDIFLQLDSLEADKTYLLNIDGYLHDFCKFGIQVSTKPAGTPVSNKVEDLSEAKLIENIAAFSWVVPENTAANITAYQLLRRKADEPRFTQIKTIRHHKNTSGASRLTYATADTLSAAGNYFYQIVAVTQQDAPLLIGTHNLVYKASEKQAENYVSLDLNYKNGTPLTVYLYNGATKTLLQKNSIIVSKKQNKLTIFTGKFREQGIRTLEIKVTDQTTNSSVSRLFKL